MTPKTTWVSIWNYGKFITVELNTDTWIDDLECINESLEAGFLI